MAVQYRLHKRTDVSAARALLDGWLITRCPADVRPGDLVKLRECSLLDQRRPDLRSHGEFVSPAAKRSPATGSAKPARAAVPNPGSGLMSAIAASAARPRAGGTRLVFVPHGDASHRAVREELRRAGVEPRRLEQIEPGRPIPLPVQLGEGLRQVASALGAMGTIHRVA
ncbi:MAG TPA: hypothetical protein VLF67_03370 [Candidatus Saccharimonas sp.]|nr:hypothetical protein [Candidatus Saccharimonas sp.]